MTVVSAPSLSLLPDQLSSLFVCTYTPMQNIVTWKTGMKFITNYGKSLDDRRGCSSSGKRWAECIGIAMLPGRRREENGRPSDFQRDPGEVDSSPQFHHAQELESPCVHDTHEICLCVCSDTIKTANPIRDEITLMRVLKAVSRKANIHQESQRHGFDTKAYLSPTKLF